MNVAPAGTFPDDPSQVHSGCSTGSRSAYRVSCAAGTVRAAIAKRMPPIPICTTPRKRHNPMSRAGAASPVPVASATLPPTTAAMTPE